MKEQPERRDKKAENLEVYLNSKIMGIFINNTY